MKRKLDNNITKENSFLISSPIFVTDIGDGFLKLTGFSRIEIEDKNIYEVFTTLLRVHKDIFNQINIKKNIECYIFTKSLDVREVTISLSQSNDYKNNIYKILEKHDSRLDDKLTLVQQLFDDNNIGCAIYSVPGLILLKANRKYLDLINPPCNLIESCIGISLKERIPKFEGSKSDELFSNVMKACKSNYYSEFRFDHYERGVTFWDGSILPIYQDGKIKYIFQTASEVTQRVVNRNKHEEQANIIKCQNEQLMLQNDLLNRQAILLNLSNEAIFAWDLYGGIIYWNKGAERKYGYSYHEAIGFTSGDLLKTIQQCNFDEYISQLVRDGVWNGEIEHTCKDGRKLIIETRQQIILNEVGQPIVLETNRDITERKKSEHQLSKAKSYAEGQSKMLNTILENTSEGVGVYDACGNLLRLNCVALQMYGFDSLQNYKNFKDILNDFEITYPDGRLILPEEYAHSKVFRGEVFSNYDMCIYNKDTDRRWIGSFSGTPIYNENNEILMTIITVRDITERKKAEGIIRTQKEQLETIIENMYEGLYITDKNGIVTMMNAEAKNQLYKPQEQLEFWDSYGNTKYLNIKGEEISIYDLPTVRALRGEIVKNDILMVRRPDKLLVIEMNVVPIYDENKNIVMTITCSHDITELVQNQQAEKEKNEALERAIEMKDEFLSLISHELKTPITVINSAIQAIELICKDELSSKAKGFINKIRQNSLRQLRLVNNLLDITKISAGHFKVNKKNQDIVFITKEIVESVYLYTQQKGIYLLVSSKAEKKIIGLDEEKYERILLNLLSNAIKFTPKGKRILVTISTKKGYVCIKVKDEGIGIPEDKQSIIFERFGQVDSSLSRQAEGSGIGLSLVKMFVESLEGSISIKSKEGSGSTFTVLLPNKKIDEIEEEKPIQELIDNRLIQATAIEFSDIYL